MADEKTKTKTTFRIDGKILNRFLELITKLGLRRDAYINDMLKYGLERLESVEPNSVYARAFLKGKREMQAGSGQLMRINVNLDGDLVKKLNEICSAKRFLRDMYVEKLFLSLIEPSDYKAAPLPEALDLIFNPYEMQSSEFSPFGGLSLGDLSEESMGAFLATDDHIREIGS